MLSENANCAYNVKKNADVTRPEVVKCTNVELISSMFPLVPSKLFYNTFSRDEKATA